MPTFSPPTLDDRTYDDLRRELVRRIPVHSAEWTDNNPGDPGIALLEVFAWLAQNLLYRLNRVPDNAQLEFLNLLDVPLMPAIAAQAMVRIDLDPSVSSPQPQLLPSGPTVPKTLVTAGKIPFQVTDELEVFPVEAVAAVKAPGPTGNDVVGLAEVTQALEDALKATPGAVTTAPYTTTLLPAPVNGVLPDPTALSAAVDQVLWIALLVPQAQAGKAGWEPTTVAQNIAGEVISVGIGVDSVLCGPDDVQQCPDPGTIAATLPLTWQIATGRFTGTKVQVDQLRYDRLAVEGDTTAGLAQTGVWRLRMPQTATPFPFGNWQFGTTDPTTQLDPALEGADDLPPLLDDDKVAARLITWIRCFRPQPASGTQLPQPVVRWVDVNTVAVLQAVTAAPEILGNGTGRPGQIVNVTRPPVIDGSLYVELFEPVGWVPWQPVTDFAAYGPGDPVYRLDPAAGAVSFGDGIHGRFPRVGEIIRATTYRYGGGVQGNVPAAAIGKVTPPAGVAKLKVVNLLPATGGVDGETVDQAKARVPQVLRNGDRAVATQDFQDLAKNTPGAGIGRVQVLPRFKPQERVDNVPGVVTVIVLPAYDPITPDRPSPDREALRKVCAYLDARRLVTTELYVIPPEYVHVWISVAFEVDTDGGYGTQTVHRWVELAVRQYLAPLPPYGRDGQGWPFGRNVTAPDVEAAVLRVEGVALVWSVLVAGDDATSTTNQVTLLSWQLPVVMGVQLSDTEAQTPTTAPAIRRSPPAAPPCTSR